MPCPALRRLPALFLIAITWTATARAQVTGSVAGTIRDASGGVLPGATVTLSGPSLQRQSVTTTTAADGTYRLPLVPPGAYQVAAELAGFSGETRRNVEVVLNQQTTLDFVLRVAGVAESVQVSAEAPVVEVTRSAPTSSVGQRTIDNLPLNGRNFTDLIALVPGAKPDPAVTNSSSTMEIFGERAGAVSYLVDGAENNDPVYGGPLLRFTQDSIREFEVITTGYEAEFGRAQGGVANIVTRSGTNDYDGRAFWFVRNNRLDASNVPPPSPLPPGYVQPAPPKLERYQWGGTLGGPIVRDRAFFFGSFEKLNETRGLNFDLTKIPAFVRSGIATPQSTEDFGLAPENQGFTGLLKGDLNAGPRHHLTASFNRSTLTNSGLVSSPVSGTLALPSAAATRDQPATSGVVRETAVFRDSMFLETTGDYVRGERGNNLGQARRSEPLLLLLNGGNGGFMQTGAPFGGKTDQLSQRFQIQQSLSLIGRAFGGDHQVKGGWDYNHVALTGFQQVQNDVEYSADFLNPNQAQVMGQNFQAYGFQQSAARFFTFPSNASGGTDLNVRSSDFALYAQDRWQVRPAVTVNAGLRYDYSSLFGDYKKAIAPRLGMAWDVGGRHRTIVKADYGLFFDRNLLAETLDIPEKGGLFTTSLFDVALPRLGVDYSKSLIDYVITSGLAGVFGPPENPLYTKFATDLRNDPLALYKLLGIAANDPKNVPVVTAANVQQLSGKTPAQAIALLQSTYPGTEWRFFDVPGGSILGDQVLSFFPRGSSETTNQVSRYSRDLVPYTNAFNVGVEQQIGENTSVSAMYIRRRSRDLLTRRIVNLFDVVKGNPNFGKTTDGGPKISEVTYDGLIDYDGIILSVTRRFSGRYQFGVSYTGSRARDNLLTGDVGSTFSNNNHPEDDYGPSNQSAPHIFSANAVVVAPFDLHVSAIAFWRSGAAFNPRGIADTDGDGLVDQRDLSVPRNGFRVKAFADLDMRVEKRVPFGRHSASALIEIFNLFNRDNVATVNAVSGTAFGQPSTYLPGREVQLGLRFFFGER
ncbi:MAG TPA: TonB-dependent receptor [Vicinamibacterales bacterium]|nr:TonB-dependent receptor [Vicinamibacterales bacterium]